MVLDHQDHQVGVDGNVEKGVRGERWDVRTQACQEAEVWGTDEQCSKSSSRKAQG